MLKIAGLLFALISSNVWGTACQLLITPPAYVKEDFGNITLSATSSNSIWLSPGMGDKTAIFNYNDLYEVTDSIGSRYFRLNGRVYNHTGTGQTFIYDLAYGFGVVPPAGTYRLKSYTNDRKSVFGRTLDTIGDSITWWQYGRYLRCLMRDSGLKYDFSGNNYDVFGFQHDGNGGAKTTNVLANMSSIPVSDSYFVLIGTNDQTTAIDTFNNIVEISQELHNKNACAKIYISTLLPRNDAFNGLNQSINTLLKDYTGWCSKCNLVDLGGYIYGISNWQSYFMADGLHPNYAGYQIISSYLSSAIN